MRVNAKLRNSAIPSANFPIHDIYQDVVIKPLLLNDFCNNLLFEIFEGKVFSLPFKF